MRRSITSGFLPVWSSPRALQSSRSSPASSSPSLSRLSSSAFCVGSSCLIPQPTEWRRPLTDSPLAAASHFAQCAGALREEELGHAAHAAEAQVPDFACSFCATSFRTFQ